MTRKHAVVLAMLMLLVLGCGGDALPPEVSDTGYEGTWQRGNERIKSRVSIVEVDGRYLFRYAKFSADGRVRVNCTWEGECEESSDGEVVARYKFETSLNEQAGRLRVECTGRIEGQNPMDVHYVDELVVIKKGLQLRSFTILDINGAYEFGNGPRVDLPKLSDHVTDPPPGWSPRSS